MRAWATANNMFALDDGFAKFPEGLNEGRVGTGHGHVHGVGEAGLDAGAGEFDLVQGGKGPQADNVRVIEQ